MDLLPKTPYRRLLVIALYTVMGALFAFILFRYIAPALMPFLIAWVFALLLSPAIETLHRRTRIPKSVLSASLVVLMVALICLILLRLCSEIYREASEFIAEIAQYSGENPLMETLTGRFPFIKSILENETIIGIYQRITRYGATAISHVADGIIGKVTALLGGVLSALPGSLIFLFITLIAAVYFCADFQGINRSLASLLPRPVQTFAINAKNQLKRTMHGYIRAYLILMTITFSEVLIGFLILKIDYAFLFSLVIAVLDILPVIGAGTFLLPSALYFLLVGDFYRGFGMAVLYIVISVIRQIAEPRVVGKSLGLHPLLSLAAIYAGYKLMGFAGMLIGPMLAIVLKNILEGRQQADIQN